ncbi:MAG TPA: YggT family protein [Candidatus Omnitrophota bacterium]|nr:YggT family protein [Candidatus Omnitrophota bacterium]
MFVLGNFLEAVVGVLGILVEVMWWLVIIRALLSWVSPDPYNPIVQFIERATEPLLAPFRSLIPTFKIGIDLSPLFAILFLYFVKAFILRTLLDVAYSLK